MSYQTLIEHTIDTLAARLQAVQVGGQPAFTTVALADPNRQDTARMPAAYIVLQKDTVKRKTQYLEIHSLAVLVSVIKAVQGTAQGDTTLEPGLHDGLTLVGAVYETLTGERTLGGSVESLEIISVDYGRQVISDQVAFWGDINLVLEIRYAPGKSEQLPVMEEVYHHASLFE